MIKVLIYLTSFLGLNFIGTKTQFYCRVCTDLMAPASRVVDAHCRSINHYNTLLSHLGKMEVYEVALIFTQYFSPSIIDILMSPK